MIAYTIADASGAPVAVHRRIEGDDGKRFTWELPDGTSGLGGFPVVDLPLYGIHRAERRSVIVCEGEKAATALMDAGMTAVGTVTGAASSPSPKALSDLAGKVAYLWPDADDPGRSHMAKVAVHLAPIAASVQWIEPPADSPKGWDAFDAMTEGGRELVEELIRGARPWAEMHPATSAPATPLTRRVVVMASVKPERVSWTWPGYIPAGKVTVEEGDPGLGKSTMTLDLAARISRGDRMPDGSPGPAAAGVVILSAEDGLADTIRPRLEAAGADLDKVVALTAILGDGERMPSLPIDLDEIEATVLDHDAALVIIDPLMAYLAADVNSHRDQDIRRTLAPLSALAERTGAAVLVVRHLNKGSGPALYRGGGSIGIIGAARAALLVAPDPEDETRRILAVSKSNLGALPPALAYRLEGDAATGAAHIVWEGATAHTAADLLATPVDDEERGARGEAADFLAEVLASGPVAATEVRRFGREAGISDRTLERAKRDLGVLSERDGFGRGSHVSWRLSAHTSPRNPIHRQPSGVASYAESGDVCESGPPEDAHEDAEDAHPQGLSTFAKVEHLRADEGDLTTAALAIFGDDILPDAELAS